MKDYKGILTLNKNARGCYILDTVKGCSLGLKDNPNGCYDDCYANRIAKRYGFNFGKTIKRDIQKDKSQFYLFGFSDDSHADRLIKQIRNIDMPFVRIGEMGDPSLNWEHTIKICKIISKAGKPIVIITKHWKVLSDSLLKDIKPLDICINTSISALDTEGQIHKKLHQFYRLKDYCNSVLRIVSCDFNKENEEGISRRVVQDELFKHTPHIDTIFRPSLNNPLVKNNVINISKVKFLSASVNASVHNKDTYFGYCGKCPDMCGVNLINNSLALT